jgi:hypothetical protein
VFEKFQRFLRTVKLQKCVFPVEEFKGVSADAENFPH